MTVTRPTLPPFASGFLTLDGTHTMYWEQSGNPNGQVVVLCHGGPGAGIDSASLQLFDTRHYRVVAYDQRGAGRSTPAGSLVDNTTDHLIDDLEVLRQELTIDNWMVFGGSWGSSLALAYAQRFPARVNALILRGIFLCQSSELDWYVNGIRHIFPEAWRQFISHLAMDDQDHPVSAYHQKVTNSDPAIHIPAARQWCLYESQCATLLPNLNPPSTSDEQCLVLARIQTHYFNHGFFTGETQLLDNIARIQSIPAELVQGRYDMVCPPGSADQLHRAWPEAHLRMVANAGHSATEPGIRRALLEATERFKALSH